MIKRPQIIAGVASLVAVILVYLLLLSPRTAAVTQGNEDLTTAQNLESTLTAELLRREDLQAQAPAMQRQLDENEHLIPKLADTSGLIRLLRLIADKTGVDFSVLSQSDPSTGDTGSFSTIQIQVSIVGRLDQVGQFLWEVENLDRAVKIVSLSMQPKEGVLTVSISAETYTTDVNSGPGSPEGSQGPEVKSSKPVDEASPTPVA